MPLLWPPNDQRHHRLLERALPAQLLLPRWRRTHHPLLLGSGVQERGESLGCNADGQHVECRFCDHPLFWDTHFSGVSCPDDDEKVGMPPSDVANGLESLASVAAPASPGAAPVKAAMGGGSRRLREVFV